MALVPVQNTGMQSTQKTCIRSAPSTSIRAQHAAPYKALRILI